MFLSLPLHWFHTAASNNHKLKSLKDGNLCLWSWILDVSGSENPVICINGEPQEPAKCSAFDEYMIYECDWKESSLLQSRDTTYLRKLSKLLKRSDHSECSSMSIANSFQSLACFNFGMFQLGPTEIVVCCSAKRRRMWRYRRNSVLFTRSMADSENLDNHHVH